MPQRPAKNIDVSRDRRFWLLASAMMVGQLLAFWLLCSHQVQRAQVREASLQAQRRALAECLRSIRGATRSSCAVENVAADGPGAAGTAGVAAAMMSKPVPVNYVYAKP